MKKKDILVLFDVGGVLLKLDFKRYYNYIANLTGLTANQFEEIYKKSNISAKSMSGQITDEEYLDEINRLVPKKIRLKELRSAKECSWVSQINEVINIKKKVYDAGYSVGIFSNISPYALNVISKKFPDIFETYSSGPKILSFEVGSIKPNEGMYKKVNGYKKIIFIDDKESYLKTGIDKFEWYGILFTAYIDKAEPIRFVHNDKTKPEKNYQEASTVSELISALKEFEIEI